MNNEENKNDNETTRDARCNLTGHDTRGRELEIVECPDIDELLLFGIPGKRWRGWIPMIMAFVFMIGAVIMDIIMGPLWTIVFSTVLWVFILTTTRARNNAPRDMASGWPVLRQRARLHATFFVGMMFFVLSEVTILGSGAAWSLYVLVNGVVWLYAVVCFQHISSAVILFHRIEVFKKTWAVSLIEEELHLLNVMKEKRQRCFLDTDEDS